MSQSKGGNKPLIRRIYAIFDALKQGGYPNCSKLAKKLEYSPKTLQRDITYMRDELGLPIEYNNAMHGYELVGDVSDFPVFDVQVEDLAAMFLARHAMQTVKDTKLAEALSPAFDKLTKQLEGKVSLNWSDLDKIFSVKEAGVVDADLTLFGKLAEAVLQQQEVSFRYRKVGDKTSINRRLRPYHVGEIDGGWYVIGYDVMREGLRTFALQRIKGLSVLKTTFERPEDFQIGKHLGGSIGVWDHQEAGSVDVVIHVTGYMARIVQERLWHSTQTTRLLDDSGEIVELKMQLGNLEEIKRLVLSWGCEATVVQPDELRDAVRKEAAAIAKNHR